MNNVRINLRPLFFALGKTYRGIFFGGVFWTVTSSRFSPAKIILPG